MSGCLTAILPVIDLKRGQVVRGVAGLRDRYRPMESRICASADPADIASALRSGLGFHDVYVADLDAIEGSVPDWDNYADIAAAGLRLWVDAGSGNAARASVLATATDPAIDRVIVGLESLQAKEELRAIVDVVGADRAVFSLDLQRGQPITNISAWSSARRIVDDLVATGIHSLIVLDLSAVGAGKGPASAELCATIRRQFADIELISGGGVRGPADVDLLLAAGCQRVLVASALHDGRITLG